MANQNDPNVDPNQNYGDYLKRLYPNSDIEKLGIHPALAESMKEIPLTGPVVKNEALNTMDPNSKNLNVPAENIVSNTPILESSKDNSWRNVSNETRLSFFDDPFKDEINPDRINDPLKGYNFNPPDLWNPNKPIAPPDSMKNVKQYHDDYNDIYDNILPNRHKVEDEAMDQLIADNEKKDNIDSKMMDIGDEKITSVANNNNDPILPKEEEKAASSFIANIASTGSNTLPSSSSTDLTDEQIRKNRIDVAVSVANNTQHASSFSPTISKGLGRPEWTYLYNNPAQHDELLGIISKNSKKVSTHKGELWKDIRAAVQEGGPYGIPAYIRKLKEKMNESSLNPDPNIQATVVNDFGNRMNAVNVVHKMAQDDPEHKDIEKLELVKYKAHQNDLDFSSGKIDKDKYTENLKDNNTDAINLLKNQNQEVVKNHALSASKDAILDAEQFNNLQNSLHLSNVQNNNVLQNAEVKLLEDNNEMHKKGQITTAQAFQNLNPAIGIQAPIINANMARAQRMVQQYEQKYGNMAQAQPIPNDAKINPVFQENQNIINNYQNKLNEMYRSIQEAKSLRKNVKFDNPLYQKESEYEIDEPDDKQDEDEEDDVDEPVAPKKLHNEGDDWAEFNQLMKGNMVKRKDFDEARFGKWEMYANMKAEKDIMEKKLKLNKNLAEHKKVNDQIWAKKKVDPRSIPPKKYLKDSVEMKIAESERKKAKTRQDAKDLREKEEIEKTMKAYQSQHGDLATDASEDGKILKFGANVVEFHPMNQEDIDDIRKISNEDDWNIFAINPEDGRYHKISWKQARPGNVYVAMKRSIRPRNVVHDDSYQADDMSGGAFALYPAMHSILRDAEKEIPQISLREGNDKIYLRSHQIAKAKHKIDFRHQLEHAGGAFNWKTVSNAYKKVRDTGAKIANGVKSGLQNVFDIDRSGIFGKPGRDVLGAAGNAGQYEMKRFQNREKENLNRTRNGMRTINNSPQNLQSLMSGVGNIARGALGMIAQPQISLARSGAQLSEIAQNIPGLSETLQIAKHGMPELAMVDAGVNAIKNIDDGKVLNGIVNMIDGATDANMMPVSLETPSKIIKSFVDANPVQEKPIEPTSQNDVPAPSSQPVNVPMKM